MSTLDAFRNRLSWHYLNGVGERLWAVIGEQFDGLLSAANDAAYASMIRYAPVDALGRLADNYNLELPENLTVAQHRRMLSESWDIWDSAGSPTRLLAEVRRLGYVNCSIVPVWREDRARVGADDRVTISYYTPQLNELNPMFWPRPAVGQPHAESVTVTLSGEAAPGYELPINYHWSSFFLIIHPPHPFNFPRWGDPIKYGDGTRYGTAGAAQELRRIALTVAKFKGASKSCRGIIFTYPAKDDKLIWTRHETDPMWCVWGVGGTVWAAGRGGQIRRWAGTGWATVASPTASGLYGMWGISANDIWAVGEGGTIVHWNGTSWSSVASPTTNTLFGMWGISANDIWAVGYGGTIVHWNGTSWSSVASPTTNTLFGVWGSATNRVWAVGYFGTILHWDGAAWAAQASGTTSDLHGVCGSAVNDVHAVGDRIARRWNGANWVAAPIDVPNDRYMAVIAFSSTDAWTVGHDGAILRWNGTSWTHQAQRSPYLRDIWGASPADIWTVGYDLFSERPPTYHLHWVGPTVTGSSGVNAIWPTSATDIWAVGDGGKISRWDGSDWAGVASPTAQHLRAAWGLAANDVWAVGDAGTSVRWSGAAWATVATGTAERLRGVWGFAADDVWAAGDNGTILNWDGANWVLATTGTTQHMRGVWGASPADLWAVGDNGTILKWGVGAWDPESSPTSQHLRCIHGISASAVYAAGDDGTVVHYDGQRWQVLGQTMAGESLLAIRAISATDVWVISSTRLWHWDGDRFTGAELFLPAGVTFSTMAAVSPGLMIGGKNSIPVGVVYRVPGADYGRFALGDGTTYGLRWARYNMREPWE